MAHAAPGACPCVAEAPRVSRPARADLPSGPSLRRVRVPCPCLLASVPSAPRVCFALASTGAAVSTSVIHRQARAPGAPGAVPSLSHPAPAPSHDEGTARHLSAPVAIIEAWAEGARLA